MEKSHKIIVILILVLLLAVVLLTIAYNKIEDLEEHEAYLENIYFEANVRYITNELDRAIKIYENNTINEEGKDFFLQTMLQSMDTALVNTSPEFHNSFIGVTSTFYGEFDEDKYLLYTNVMKEINLRLTEFYSELETYDAPTKDVYVKFYKKCFSDPVFLDRIKDILSSYMK